MKDNMRVGDLEAIGAITLAAAYIVDAAKIKSEAAHYHMSLRNMVEIQGTDGNWDASEYGTGYFNGLELALASYERRDPQFKDIPEALRTASGQKTYDDGFAVGYKQGHDDREAEAQAERANAKPATFSGTQERALGVLACASRVANNSVALMVKSDLGNIGYKNTIISDPRIALMAHEARLKLHIVGITADKTVVAYPMDQIDSYNVPKGTYTGGFALAPVNDT